MNEENKVTFFLAAMTTAKEDLNTHRVDRENTLSWVWKSLLVLVSIQGAPELFAAVFSSQVSTETAGLLRGTTVEFIRLIAIWVTSWHVGKLVDESTTVKLLYARLMKLELQLGELIEGRNPFEWESVYFESGGKIELRRKAVNRLFFALVVVCIVLVSTAGAWMSTDGHVLIALGHTLVAYMITRDIVLYTIRGSAAFSRSLTESVHQLKPVTNAPICGLRVLMLVLCIRASEIDPADKE